MVCGVVFVGLIVRASAGAFLYLAAILTLAVAFWLWMFRRFRR
jgi:hypothetical protein